MPPSDILVFGEDHNDRAAISYLIKAIVPNGSKIGVKAIRSPIVLAKAARPEKRKKMAEEIAGFARGFEKVGKKVTVVAHRDCDDYEPAHINQTKLLEQDLKSAGVSSAVAATPAWEIESWWMLFPKAIETVRPSWARVDYGNRNVGKIQNAKETLTRDLRPSNNPRCKDFHESDGAKVAEHVAKSPSHLASLTAKSESFEYFQTRLLLAINDKPLP